MCRKCLQNFQNAPDDELCTVTVKYLGWLCEFFNGLLYFVCTVGYDF